MYNVYTQAYSSVSFYTKSPPSRKYKATWKCTHKRRWKLEFSVDDEFECKVGLTLDDVSLNYQTGLI